MPLPPYPVSPAPATWTAGEVVSAPELRADPGNAALLLANPPMLVAAQLTTGQTMGTSATPITLDTEFLDGWAGHVPGQASYRVPLDGWYLSELAAEYSVPASTTSALCGFTTATSGTSVSREGGRGCGNSTGAIGMCAAELSQHYAASGDTITPYGAATVATALTTGSVNGARFKTVWVASNDSPVVVASPQPAALWPPGSGTAITSVGGIPAGATTVSVASATGMVVGGSLGLDYLNGVQTSAGAEKVTITSVTGTSVGISATSYSHAQGAPVAVPVSAAWMNQQVRDVIRYLAYPPMVNLNTAGTSATLASGGPGTAITFTGAAVDNFTGWNSATEYVFPVGGVYFVFGQVYVNQAASFEAAAGLSVSGGTVMWGTTQRNTSATTNYLCATVRRHLRVTAGQNVQLYGYQNTAGTLALMGSGNAYCKLIAVWRGF